LIAICIALTLLSINLANTFLSPVTLASLENNQARLDCKFRFDIGIDGGAWQIFSDQNGTKGPVDAMQPDSATDKQIDFTYNAERVAAIYGGYAAVASNSYRDANSHFDLRNLSLLKGGAISEEVDFKYQFKQGFGATALFIEQRKIGAEFLAVLAFRGTDSWVGDDMLSNASYIFYGVNADDQYKQARDVFMQFRKMAEVRAAGRPIRYIVVGHSLGGGLARHIAAGFPCVTAITFNASFVTNELKYTCNMLDEHKDGPCPCRRKSKVISIFEDDDMLSWSGMHLFPEYFFANNTSHVWYRMHTAELIDAFPSIRNIKSEHKITKLAAAMLRFPASCFQRNDCSLSETVDGDRDRNYPAETIDKETAKRNWCETGPRSYTQGDDICSGGGK
jgi:pimeloyl-ACP methyl ester carboxylesterase